MKRIYLDNAATSPVAAEVREAVEPYLAAVFGNPSSVHSYGQEARTAVEAARETVAGFIGARGSELVFTSGGTEANNYALKGVAYANEHKGRHIVTSSIEHHAVLEPCRFLETRGFRVTYVPVDHDGLVDPDDIKKAIGDDTILVSVMHANNEVGTIQPIAEIGRIARAAGVYFHTDAVQTVGHLGVNVDELGVDLLSMSAHKFYGPKGVGALYVREGTVLDSFVHGGAQEEKRRAGTQNVPAIAGFARAVQLALQEMDSEAERQTRLRDRFAASLLASMERVWLNGHPTRRLPNNVNVSVDLVDGEAMLLNLDLEGICVSSGSACSSSSHEPSHVLVALGYLPEQCRGSLRLSLGRTNTEEDVGKVLAVLPGIVERLRALSPSSKPRK